MSPSEEIGTRVRHYLPSLTGLRFIAAATIFLGHMAGSFSFTLGGTSYSPGMLNALGMPLFFVLSGFIVHYNYAESFQSQPLGQSAKNFILARFSRIYPLFFFFFVFYLVQDNLLLNWMEEGKALFICACCFLGIFTWFPIYTHNHLLLQYGSFSVSWSIATEFFFYWAYIFMARPISRLNTTRKATWFFFICIIVGYAVQIPGPWDSTHSLIQQVWGTGHPKGSGTFLDSQYRWTFYHSPYSRIFEFLLGCATAQLFFTSGPQLQFKRLQNVGLGVVIFMILIVLFLLNLAFSAYTWSPVTGPLPIRYFIHLYMNFLFAPLMAALILIFALRDVYYPQFRKILSHPKLVFLGEISLSLYLLHPLVITLLPVRPGMTFVLVRMFFSVGLIIALAIGTYTLIEVPCRRFLRQWFHVGKRSHSPVVVKISS